MVDIWSKVAVWLGLGSGPAIAPLDVCSKYRRGSCSKASFVHAPLTVSSSMLAYTAYRQLLQATKCLECCSLGFSVALYFTQYECQP